MIKIDNQSQICNKHGQIIKDNAKFYFGLPKVLVRSLVALKYSVNKVFILPRLIMSITWKRLSMVVGIDYGQEHDYSWLCQNN